MSTDAIARLESLLARVVARRAEPRVTAPVAAPVIATSPAPRAITPEPARAEAPRVEARRPDAPKPEAPTVEVQMIVPAEARRPEPVVVAEAPKPADPAKPVEPAKPAAGLTLDAPRAPGAPKPTPAAPLKPAIGADRIAASFAAGASVSPGFDDDDADHIDTLAFRMDRALPKPSPVSIPPLPVSTPTLAREETVERSAERFSPSLPPGALSAHVSALPTQSPAASLRSLLQRSVAIRPRG